MNIESIREYCLSKPNVSEHFPFDEVTLVFKVYDKMFALISTDEAECSINLKCDPDYAIELREQYKEIQPGYHMNKKHWNTVHCKGSIQEKLVVSLINHSYDLVLKNIPKSHKKYI